MDVKKYAATPAFLLVVLLLAELGLVSPSAAGAGGTLLAAAPSGVGNDYTDQLIVKFRDRAQAQSSTLVRDSVAALSATAGVTLKHQRAMSGNQHVLKLPKRFTVTEAEALARKVAADPAVEYAEADRIMFPMLVPNDPSYPSQWHYQSPDAPGFQAGGANLPGARDITTGSSGIVIAVLDTGIVPHADLEGRTVPGYNFISDPFIAGNGVGRSSDPSDLGDSVLAGECSSSSPASNSTFHGTHVAGTIGAASNNGIGVAGVNWTSKLLPVRVLGKCGGYVSDIVDAIRWAAGIAVPGISANANPARVINLSLGGTGVCQTAYQGAIDEVTAAGSTVVVAAGNSDADCYNFSPASCSKVITVASVNRLGGRAFYSNFGTSVAISGPGGEQGYLGDPDGVLSTLNSGATSPVATPSGDTYEYYQGTSMAAPHISGVVSLMLSVKPSLTPAQVQEILQGTARPFPTDTGSMGGDCTRLLCGAGIVDATGAVRAVIPPVIGTTVKSIGFAAFAGARTSVSNSLGIYNTGGGSLQWSVSGDASWLVLSPRAGTGDGTVAVSADATGLAAGSYTAAITVAAAGSSNTPVTIPVALTVSSVDNTAPSVTAFTVPAGHNSLTVPITLFTATDNFAVTGYLITASTGVPAATAGWSATAPASFTFSTPGIKTLYAWVKDAAGNVSAYRAATVTIDLIRPAVLSFGVKNPSDSLTVPITALTATDNIGIAGYLINETPDAPGPSAPGWQATAPLNYTAALPGKKTLYAWVKDRAGNVSLSRSALTTIDTDLPVVTVFQVPALVKTLAIPVTRLLATDAIGVTGYLITVTGTPPLPSFSTWTATPPATFYVTSQGVKTLYAWSKDVVGHVSAAKSATVNVDLTPPVVTSFSLKTPVNTLTVPVLALTATDSTGVTGYLITESYLRPAATAVGWSDAAPLSYTFTTPGVKTLYAWAKDKAGNVSAARSAAVTIDMTAPVVGAFSVKRQVNSLTVPITAFTGSDNVGMAGYLITETPDVRGVLPQDWKTAAPTSYSTGTAGDRTLYAWVRDRAGNLSAPKSAVTTIDLDAPVVTAFEVPAAVNTLAIPIKNFTALDRSVAGYLVTLSSTPPAPTAAGWTVYPPKSFYVSTTGAKTLYAWSKDAAGNVSAYKSATVKVDMTSPVIGAFAVQAPATGLTVTVTAFTATDAELAGVAGYLITESYLRPLPTAVGWSATAPGSYSFATPGTKTLYAWVKDAAGNISGARAVSVTVRPVP
jgi:subtilisin family serine protease